MPDAPVNPLRKARLRSETIAWLSSPPFTHAITLSPNQKEIGLPRLRKLFGLFCLWIDRIRFNRRRVDKLETWQRFNAVALPEKLEGNPHMHLAVNFCPTWWSEKIGDGDLQLIVRELWAELTRGSGSYHLTPIRDAGWPRYITKEIYRHDHEFFLAADFHPSDRVVSSLNETLRFLAGK